MANQYALAVGEIPLPVCYTPGTVMLVDDNTHFLEGLCLSLGFEQRCQPMNSVARAHEFLLTHYQSMLCPQAWLELEDETEFDIDEATQSVKLRLQNIHKLAFNPERLQEIPLVIVDYAMPEMNGLAFCKKIEQLPCKKIILTGVADLEVAVQGFNQGVIDQFIVKNSESNFVHQLEQVIYEFRWQYFQEQSQSLLDQLALQKTQCALFEPAYQILLKQWVLELSIVEYYLMDKAGSLLLMDQKGTCYWLLVMTDVELENYIDIAQATDGVPSELLNLLKNKHKAPYFYCPEDHQTAVENWYELLHEINPLATTHYYTALVQAPLDYGLSRSPIAPYHEA